MTQIIGRALSHIDRSSRTRDTAGDGFGRSVTPPLVNLVDEAMAGHDGPPAGVAGCFSPCSLRNVTSSQRLPAREGKPAHFGAPDPLFDAVGILASSGSGADCGGDLAGAPGRRNRPYPSSVMSTAKIQQSVGRRPVIRV
ncbi:MAG: hypothetical protein WAW17_11400 [Rhodococcus sp. (in: high G+C Gram-positive bacteria)]|uniref:hypothetical protein n=1 Tax=Rhodococcus sp. TaxID=1831 RepID=UPI003BAEF901